MRATHALLLVFSASLVWAADRHILLLQTQPPEGWEVLSPPPSSHPVSFYIALPQRNIDQLNTLFEHISDPLHIQYGQYLNREQILSIVAPPKQTAERVLAALPADISCVDMGDALKCRGSVASVEQAFHTELRFVRHRASGLSLIRQIGDFSVPSSIAADVQVR